jgi:hypothetical protein
MAERATRAAGFWPRHVIDVATRVLPRGVTRDRHRQEFLAELYSLGTARQLRHAFGVLSRSWALLVALNTPSQAAAAGMEIAFPRRRQKRYSVRRTGEGDESLDADAAGTQVFFSTSRKAARGMSRQLNRRGDRERPPGERLGGSSAGVGWGG